MIKITNVKSLYSALYQAVQFCKENEKENIEIVVPDKLSLFMEKFLFEQMNISASFNIKVSTLNRLAKRSVVVSKEKQISKVGSIILVHKILNENINDLKVLKSKAFSFSYAEEIFATIGQLKASKIQSDEMKKFTHADEQLSGKIHDLALIYQAYEDLKAGLLDASDVFLMSSMFVGKEKSGIKFLFVGFDDFTAIEYSIIENFAISNDVNIINYASNKGNKYIYNSEVVSQLRSIARIKELPIEIENANQDENGLKVFLENNIYSVEKQKYLLDDEIVKIYSGNSVEDQIEFVARDIRNSVIDGDRFDDFGVAVFGIDSCEEKIRQIFQKFEINFYIDSEISITKSILFKFFISVFKYNLEGFNVSSLIDMINSPFLPLSREIKHSAVQQLISTKFRGDISKFDFDLDEEERKILIDFVNKFTFERTENLDIVIEQLKSVDGLIENVLESISSMNLERKVLLQKSKEVIFNLFDDILRFNSEITIAEFFDIFKHSSSVVKVNNLPLKLDAVKIVDANNTMEIFKKLYIVGANQDNAPNLKYDCGIILDGEIEKLNFSHKLCPTISHINRLARLRLFNCISLFEDELTIAYSNSQSDIIKELIEKIQVKTKDGIIDLIPISKFGYEKYVALSEWDYVEFLCKNDKNNIKISEKTQKNKDFLKISEKSRSIYSDLNVASATLLENYFKCPMMAFFNNILKIKPRLELEILSLDIGNVLHEIMFKYYKLNKKVEDVYEFCKMEVFKCVEKEERLKLNFDSPILINLIDEAVRVINALNYIDENSDFKPKFFEFEFKGSSALKLRNIDIVGKVDRVDVCNDMFRIVDYKSGKADASLKELYYGNKLQLFLYSCAMENVLKKSSVGAFYLPLHNAYTKELGNTYSLKGFYLAEDFVVKAFDKRLDAGCKSDIVNVTMTKSNSVRKSIGYKELSNNQLNALKLYSKIISENAIDEIKQGYIAPNPSGVSKPCEYCAYAHICLKESCNISYREASKVNLESFEEVDND